MRLFTPGKRAESTDVYVPPLDAVDFNGNKVAMAPGLALPHSKATSGALSTKPIDELFIKELVGAVCIKI